MKPTYSRYSLGTVPYLRSVINFTLTTKMLMFRNFKKDYFSFKFLYILLFLTRHNAQLALDEIQILD